MHVFLPILKRKGLKGDNLHVHNSNSYLVTYNWKGLLTIQIMTFTEGVYVSLAKMMACQKFSGCLTLTCCHFGQG